VWDPAPDLVNAIVNILLAGEMESIVYAVKKTGVVPNAS